MPSKILIRGLSDQLHEWLAEQSHERRVSRNDFILSLLQETHKGNVAMPAVEQTPAPVVGPQAVPFSFIDLFAGIGGLRIGLERVGGRCVDSCEWDKYSQKTYLSWFGEEPKGDLTKLDISKIPDHDVLAAGFPCQPFSIAGVSKKNSLGRAHGFKDATQGTLFFNVANIIEQRRPPVVMLENVKNLRSHDGGRTWCVIRGVLDDLDYEVFAEVVDAAGWVPQHRERIFIVGFDRKLFGSKPPFEFPKAPAGTPPTFASILEPNPDPKYTLSNHLWTYLRDYAKKHREAGNGFGYGLADLNGVSRTLSARYYKDGSEVLIPQRGKNPRRLTPREAAKLMGFDPDRYRIVVSDTQAYRQFGNAVVPPVAEAVGRQIARVICWQLARQSKGCLLKSGVSTRGMAPARRARPEARRQRAV